MTAKVAWTTERRNASRSIESVVVKSILHAGDGRGGRTGLWVLLDGRHCLNILRRVLSSLVVFGSTCTVSRFSLRELELGSRSISVGWMMIIGSTGSIGEAARSRGRREKVDVHRGILRRDGRLVLGLTAPLPEDEPEIATDDTDERLEAEVLDARDMARGVKGVTGMPDDRDDRVLILIDWRAEPVEVVSSPSDKRVEPDNEGAASMGRVLRPRRPGMESEAGMLGSGVGAEMLSLSRGSGWRRREKRDMMSWV